MSIIIDNYNYGHFLRDAIGSALDQTYPHTEVIVVDDGSTDDSRSIIAGYGGRIFPVLKANGGQASALNAGFAASHGNAILFLDADDLLSPSTLAHAVPALMQSGVAKVHWPVRQADAEARPTGALIPHALLPHGDFREDLARYGPDACLTAPLHGNLLARRAVAEVLPIPEAPFRRHGADVHLVSLVSLFGSVTSLPCPYGFYRMHAQNTYARLTIHEKNHRNIEVYPHRCRALASHLRDLGVPATPNEWTAGSHFAWMLALDHALQELCRLISPGQSFALLDDAYWADQWGSTSLLADRHAIRFREQEGQYLGPPGTDAEAIAEFERVSQFGIAHLVVAWPALWWLDHYTRFTELLYARAIRVHRNDRLALFSFKSAEPTGSDRYFTSP